MTQASKDHMNNVLQMVDQFVTEIPDLEKFDYIDKLAAALEERMTSILEQNDYFE